jgi:hypothetical protein
LISLPGRRGRDRGLEPDRRQPICAAEVRDLNGNTPAMVVMGHPRPRRHRVLRQPSVSLGDDRARSVGEIERTDCRATLPAAVSRGIREAERRRPVRGVANPLADDGDSLDWK